MKKFKLTGEYKERREKILKQIAEEIEQEVPEPKGWPDQRPDQIRSAIFERHKGELIEVIREAKSNGAISDMNGDSQ